MNQIIQNTEDGSIYNKIGSGYAQTRREDPELYNRILNALGDSKTAVNIGAGTGSYEPKHLQVLAVEPSEVMVKQRKSSAGPAINATADHLPLHDKSFDAAMAVLSIHHWHPNAFKGVKEMCRVARKKIVVVTYDSRVSNKMWLISDYLKEVAELDAKIFPNPETICEWIDGKTQIESVLQHRDTPDWNLGSFWAHPERVLNSAARAATSGFSRQPAEVVKRVVSAVEKDLNNGQWDRKYGHLRNLKELDVGLRIITADLS